MKRINLLYGSQNYKLQGYNAAGVSMPIKLQKAVFILFSYSTMVYHLLRLIASY